jgi:phosphoribosyl-AMP cyclohydrolase
VVIPNFLAGVDGLLPAIAQDEATGRVLMMAWMNREAWEETLRTGEACYYSRSRRKLWRKGEESGNVQQLLAGITRRYAASIALADAERHFPAAQVSLGA